MFFYDCSYCLHMLALGMIFLDIVGIIFVMERYDQYFEFPVSVKSQLLCCAHVFLFRLVMVASGQFYSITTKSK